MIVDKAFPNFFMIPFAGSEFISFGEFVNVRDIHDFYVEHILYDIKLK
jgi:hypothetical protein